MRNKGTRHEAPDRGPPIPRRPLDADKPDGYLESDRDWVLNNLDWCVAKLEEATTPTIGEILRQATKDYSDSRLSIDPRTPSPL